MRLALLGPASSIHLQRWVAALASRGHELLVISQHRCDRDLLPASVEIAWLPHQGSLGYFRNALLLRRTLARWQPDLLNVHYASGYGTTAALCGFGPTLLSVWGSDVYDFPYESFLKGRLIRWNLRRATALASTSRAMAQQVQRLTPERREIAVTPFGVDLAHFSPRLLRLAPDGLTIGTVKSLAPKYGVDLLLHAFSELLADAEVHAVAAELKLLIVGDGPERAALEALAWELGIEQRTQFKGAVAHVTVPLWLGCLDIYVAPSRMDSESFGVAVIEASACALPVVVSDVGGLPEVVRDGETGIVVPRNDVSTLREALKCLVLDPSRRNELGRQGRAWVEQEYEWGHCITRMEQCYEDTIARAKR